MLFSVTEAGSQPKTHIFFPADSLAEKVYSLVKAIFIALYEGVMKGVEALQSIKLKVDYKLNPEEAQELSPEEEKKMLEWLKSSSLETSPALQNKDGNRQLLLLVTGEVDKQFLQSQGWDTDKIKEAVAKKKKELGKEISEPMYAELREARKGDNYNTDTAVQALALMDIEGELGAAPVIANFSKIRMEKMNEIQDLANEGRDHIDLKAFFRSKQETFFTGVSKETQEAEIAVVTQWIGDRRGDYLFGYIREVNEIIEKEEEYLSPASRKEIEKRLTLIRETPLYRQYLNYDPESPVVRHVQGIEQALRG